MNAFGRIALSGQNVVGRLLFATTLAVLFAACNSEATPAEPFAEEPLWRTSTAEPYPFTTPIPPLERTAIDGTYTRSVSQELAGGSVKCRRCAPYRIEMGETTLVFEEGRYFVSHVAPRQPDSSQFRSRGHFVIEGARLTLFNDANCSRERGVYEWRLSQGRLRLRAVDDPCPFSQLRERFLEASAWSTDA